jgi:ATP-binding cassette subfamily F protein 3
VVPAPGTRVALLEQQRDFGEAATVWDAAAAPLAALFALEQRLAATADEIGRLGDAAPAELLARYGHDLERFAHEDGYAARARVDAVLHGLGFDPEDARGRGLATLSGGERGRVGLARQLVTPADLLLLDEPTNHLDLDTSAWLEEYLRNIDETVLLVSHDRVFLERVVDHVLHVENGTATPYAGDYDAFVAQRTERRLGQQRAFDKQRRVIAAEEDYIRRNIAGGNSRQAKGRRRRLARVPRLSPPPGEEGAMALRFETGARSGDQVVVAERVAVAAGGRTLLTDFSARVLRGDVVGLVGPNGAGKSTLLRTLVGERGPDAGTVRVGDSVTLAYYRQDLGQVPPSRTLFDVIGDTRPTWTRGQIQDHLGRFGFSGDEVLRVAGTLSGGEQARLALAMMVLARANFLVFDEPTNHLDVASIEALEDAIEEYDGTVLLVSHDRALLRALTTRTWALRDGRIADFPGGFEEWEIAEAERARVAKHDAARAADARREREAGRRAAPRPASSASEQRRLRRAAEAAEAAVHEEEARVAELEQALADPALYTEAEGPRRAAALATELEIARTALDEAFTRWADASAASERAG